VKREAREEGDGMMEGGGGGRRGEEGI